MEHTFPAVLHLVYEPEKLASFDVRAQLRKGSGSARGYFELLAPEGGSAAYKAAIGRARAAPAGLPATLELEGYGKVPGCISYIFRYNYNSAAKAGTDTYTLRFGIAPTDSPAAFAKALRWASKKLKEAETREALKHERTP